LSVARRLRRLRPRVNRLCGGSVQAAPAGSVRRCCEAALELCVGLARTPSKAQSLGIEIRPGDYGDRDQLKSSLRPSGPRAGVGRSARAPRPSTASGAATELLCVQQPQSATHCVIVVRNTKSWPAP
jgi:hypothetical protein